MDDFIFGTLATDEHRLAHVRALLGGITHLSARRPRNPSPGEPVELELTVGPTYACDQAWVYWSVDGDDPRGAYGKPQHGSVTSMQLSKECWDNLEWGYIRRYNATLPGQPDGTVVRYYLAIRTLAGEEIPADGGAFYSYYAADDPIPEWSRDAIVYQIFVDRFFPGGGKSWAKPDDLLGIFGGAIRGITEKLDYITELGANTLWLSPIFPSPSHHGYDATDYFNIEPRLGTKDEFVDLLNSAHERKMRLILDFVPNHWSHLHTTFQEAQNNPDSSYRDWYVFQEWPHKYESFFGVESLPQINLRHQEARMHMLEAVEYWLQLGIDGYRLDYAIGPTRDFWADFRRSTRNTNPACWTFGEVVEPSDSQLSFHGLLDGCLDFLLLEAMRETFAFQRWDAYKFMSFLDRHETYFPDDFSRPSFLDNHDMNRFMWAVEGDIRKLKIAALCQFTLVGPPVIYYGTEVGLSQERDVRQDGMGLLEESRLPMLWGDEQDHELLAYYRDLIALRNQEPALRTGKRENLILDPQIVSYKRMTDGRTLATIINLSPETQQVSLPGAWRNVALGSDLDIRITVQAEKTILNLPALSGAVVSE